MRQTSNVLFGAEHIRSKITAVAILLAVAVLSFAIGLQPAFASGNNASVVYDNIPSPTPGNVPSVGYEATSTSEFGGQLQLAGNARTNPTVKVLMSSWACKSGTWNAKNCITNAGSTFTHPVTLNVYEVNDDNSVGGIITSETKTFTMPYRPTADDGTNCNDAHGTAGQWWDGTSCYNGKAFPISFDLDSDITLPSKVIVSVSYNTSHFGEDPIGTTACNATLQGCPYDSLNVGTSPAPTVGMAKPTLADAYQDSDWSGAYCPLDTTTGTFRLDAGCWTGYQPAFEVSASKTNNKPSHGHKWSHKKHNNSGNHYGDNGHQSRNSHGFYSIWNR